MAKNIVFPYVMFTKFLEEPLLKKLAITFDNIYVDEGRLNQILRIDTQTLSEEIKLLAYEKSVWEYLAEKNIVQTYPYIFTKFTEVENTPEGAHLIDLYKQTMPNYKPEHKLNAEETRIAALETFFLSHDISIRLDALSLSSQHGSEFYPMLRTGLSFQQQEKKSSVVQFLLNNIPQPSLETSWEQIIDFRNDEEMRLKYLALMNWVNRAAVGSSSLNDIKEEYEYLYNDYIKHLKLHKLKYNFSLLEIVVSAGSSLLIALQSGEFISSFKNLFQLNLSHIKLLEEEAKLPGKEVAYIYHAKQKFGLKN